MAQADGRTLDLRANGQVVTFDGFLRLYQEGRDDAGASDDEDGGRLPRMSERDPLVKETVEAAQHFTEPPPRFTEATIIKRMEELGIGRPSTYDATVQTLKAREYVKLDKKRLVPEDKGRLVIAFLESFFARYVGYDFTADLEEKLDRISNHEIDWKQVLRDFWVEFSSAVLGTKDLRTTEVLDNLNEVLGPHIFPQREDGGDPRQCQVCGTGQLSLKLGKFGAFVGCSNYPECKFTRQLNQTGETVEGEAGGGPKVLGLDPDSEKEVTLRDGRFGPYIQLGEPAEGEKPKRSSLPKGLSPGDVTLDQALALLSLPREVARHPGTKEPIFAALGRYGPYVQHGKTYANLGKDDDVLEIGGNRAIDLIVAKESGLTGRRFGGGESAPSKMLGDHPAGGAVALKAGRYGPVCQLQQGQCDAAEGRRSDDLHLGGRPRPAFRQGEWRGRRVQRAGSVARRASAGRGDHRATGPFRPLREPRQDQCDAQARHVAGKPDPRRGDPPCRRQGGCGIAQAQGAGQERRGIRPCQASRQDDGRQAGECQETAGEEDGRQDGGLGLEEQGVTVSRWPVAARSPASRDGDAGERTLPAW